MKYRIFIFSLIFIFSMIFIPFLGTPDVDIWMRWLHNVDTRGIVSGYVASHGDYPFLSHAILYIVAKLSHVFRIDIFMVFKISLFTFLLLTFIVFLNWTKDFFISLALYTALILNSVSLGYLDIFVAPFVILSLQALKENNLLIFTILFAIASLIKWQPIIIAPFLLVYLLNIKRMPNRKKIDFVYLIKCVALPIILICIFVLGIFRTSIIFAFRDALSKPFLNGNALNANWILSYLLHMFYPERFGKLINGCLQYISLGERNIIFVKLIFLTLYTIPIIEFIKRDKTFENLILYSLIGYAMYFMFCTSVHENHLFLVVILAAILWWINNVYATTFLIWSLIMNINLFVFYGIDGRELHFTYNIGGVDITLMLSIFNVFFFLVFFTDTIKKKA